MEAISYDFDNLVILLLDNRGEFDRLISNWRDQLIAGNLTIQFQIRGRDIHMIDRLDGLTNMLQLFRSFGLLRDE